MAKFVSDNFGDEEANQLIENTEQLRMTNLLTVGESGNGIGEFGGPNLYNDIVQVPFQGGGIFIFGVNVLVGIDINIVTIFIQPPPSGARLWLAECSYDPNDLTDIVRLGPSSRLNELILPTNNPGWARYAVETVLTPVQSPQNYCLLVSGNNTNPYIFMAPEYPAQNRIIRSRILRQSIIGVPTTYTGGEIPVDIGAEFASAYVNQDPLLYFDFIDFQTIP